MTHRYQSPLAPGVRATDKLIFWSHWALATAIQTSLLIFLTLNKTSDVASHYRLLIIVSSLISVPLCVLFRAFSSQNGYLIGLARFAAAWATLMATLTFLAFVTKTSELFSREVILQWIVGGAVLQGTALVGLQSVFLRLDRNHRNSRPSLIIGTGRLALDLATKLSHERGEVMLGLVSLGTAAPFNGEENSQFPTLGAVSELRRILKDNDVSRVYIALPAKEADQIEDLYVDLLDAQVDVVWIPDFANLKLLNHSVHDLGGMPAIHLNESPLTSDPGAALMKSFLERGLALFGLVMLAPLLIACALAVKLSSPGPVLFRQERHGWNGAIIEVLKFRSMRVHTDNQLKQAQKGDPRVTPVGRILRRTSLDELPQLINVIKGDMALVGPRPHAVVHNDYYSDKIIAYMARHRIKPGITGMAQISGYRGETETLEKMQKRVELDLAYINQWSLWLDMKILLKTPLSLFSDDIY
ncbi:undecaprenyl-phosphate glucose phosphotransferase [Marinobacter arenosus]|uniref:undecaprenyl-phosphate glucose phosphotransferase n=1 Tax=Marinobacter arenosus TaxID=2856822 RepID=UPI0035E400D1